jgi:hypothetical protein
MPTQDTAGRPYAPPAAITVTPPPFLITDRNTAGDQLVIVLDTEAGTLHAEKHDGRTMHDRSPVYLAHRDLYFPGAGHDWFTRSARRIAWTPNHWPTYPATRESFLRVLGLMARWAKVLVDALEPLPDGGWDWTLKATAAFERIDYLTGHGDQPLTEGTPADDPWFGDGTGPLPDRHHYGIVSFDEVLAAAGPDWANPVWATLGDPELDLVAASIHRKYGAVEIPEQFRKRIGFDLEDKLRATIQFHRRRREDATLADDNKNLPIYVIGARAGLRRWRANFIADAAGHPAEHAAVFLAGHPEAFPATLRAASSDAEVARIAEVLDAEVAHQHRLALVATPSVLAAARAEMRELKRAELAACGDAYTHAALELRQLADRRAGLLLEVASFQEAPEWDAEKDEPNYAELGRLSRMTRQAARERLLAGEPAPAPVPDDDVAAAVRAHLRGTIDGRSAAQLADHLADVGLVVPREQLDRVLAAMAGAGDVRKRGKVGPEYTFPR